MIRGIRPGIHSPDRAVQEQRLAIQGTEKELRVLAKRVPIACFQLVFSGRGAVDVPSGLGISSAQLAGEYCDVVLFNKMGSLSKIFVSVQSNTPNPVTSIIPSAGIQSTKELRIAAYDVIAGAVADLSSTAVTLNVQVIR